MLFAAVFSVAAPLVSLSILLAAVFFPHSRPYRRFIVPAGAGLSFIGVLFTLLEPAQVTILSRWRPGIFFGSSPALLAGPEVWLLAVGLCGAVLAGALVQLGRVAEPPFTLGISTLGMLAAGLVALWGENLLTVLLAWCAFDMAWGLGMLAGGLPVRRVMLGAGLNIVATTVLWAGALTIEGRGGGLSWSLMDARGLGGDLLLIAGLLRLGLYPLHLALPTGNRRGLPGAAPLLLGPALGWGVLARLSVLAGGAITAGPWLEGIAAATFVGGGMLAWTRIGADDGWPWVSVAVVGEVLWAGLLAGDAALPVLEAGGAVWLLGITLLYLNEGLNRAAPWWSVGPFLGGLALLGALPTLGWASVAAISGSLLTPFLGGRVLAFLLGQALLTAGVARRLMRAAQERAGAGPLFTAARAAGIALPVILLLGGGIGRGMLLYEEGIARLLAWPGLAGWALWGAGTGLGVLLFWQENRLRQSGPIFGLLHDVLRLEWVANLILSSLERLSSFLGEVADVIEGPGAILWALAIFLLGLLAMVGR